MPSLSPHIPPAPHAPRPSRTSRSSGRSISDGGIPWMLVLAAAASVPTHIVVWYWFAGNGIDLVHDTARSILSDPAWLTSVLYFPIGVLLLAITESAAMAPLNLLLLVFGLRQYQALRGSKHFSSYRAPKAGSKPSVGGKSGGGIALKS